MGPSLLTGSFCINGDAMTFRRAGISIGFVIAPTYWIVLVSAKAITEPARVLLAFFLTGECHEDRKDKRVDKFFHALRDTSGNRMVCVGGICTEINETLIFDEV